MPQAPALSDPLDVPEEERPLDPDDEPSGPVPEPERPVDPDAEPVGPVPDPERPVPAEPDDDDL